MKRNTVLNFFDISSDLEVLPENELFKIKGGNSDIAYWDEIDPVDVVGEGNDDEPEDNYEEDDWYDEEWEAYLEELAEDLREGGSSTGQGSNTNTTQEVKLPLETLKKVLKTIYSKDSETIWRMIGEMVEYNHINFPDSFKDTCALRISLALNALGSDFAITRDGYGDLKFGSGDWNNDGNKEWYLYKAADMQTYLTSQFGSAVEVNGTSGIPQGAEGFLYYQGFEGTDRVYNHIDYWDGSTVLGGNDYSNAKGVQVYFIRTN